jgi:hypothetical protein
MAGIHLLMAILTWLRNLSPARKRALEKRKMESALIESGLSRTQALHVVSKLFTKKGN